MLKLYNYLTRKKETFKPIHKQWVGLYTCGPTVYNYVHIGNLRTFIFEDVLKRILEYAGYKVRHIMNITDVDDKVIKGARESGKNIYEFVKPYEKAFFEDLKKLNIEKAWKYPKATEHIQDMIKVISVLLKKGFAYEMDGSIYFDISKFKNYGKLSRVKSRKLKDGARVDTDEYNKQDVQDFVLWKGRRDNEPSWNGSFSCTEPSSVQLYRTKFGTSGTSGAEMILPGRPGWHIECSAMSTKYLGDTFDIHAGGVDLMFPHHENEIAQSETASGKKFVKFFIEGEHLLVNGEKMSKSLENIFTLRDIESHRINPLAFRYLVLGAHYRAKLNFTWESLKSAEQSYERLFIFIQNLQNVKNRAFNTLKNPRLKSRIKSSILLKYKNEFQKALFDDLDTPKSLAVVWKLIHSFHKNPEIFDPKETLNIFYDFDRVLGLGLKNIRSEKIPKEIFKLVQEREQYRKEKKWQEADKIRQKILNMGWEIMDSAEGPKFSRI